MFILPCSIHFPVAFKAQMLENLTGYWQINNFLFIFRWFLSCIPFSLADFSYLTLA